VCNALHSYPFSFFTLVFILRASSLFLVPSFLYCGHGRTVYASLLVNMTQRPVIQMTQARRTIALGVSRIEFSSNLTLTFTATFSRQLGTPAICVHSQFHALTHCGIIGPAAPLPKDVAQAFTGLVLSPRLTNISVSIRLTLTFPILSCSFRSSSPLSWLRGWLLPTPTGDGFFLLPHEVPVRRSAHLIESWQYTAPSSIRKRLPIPFPRI